MIIMKRISILGAGWLGAPLAIRLKDKGHEVKVSTTTVEKMTFFAEQGIPSFLIHVGTNSNDAVMAALLRNTDILLITIPPGRSQQTAEGDYVAKIRSVIPFIEQHGIKEVVFTSSTTVYLSLMGEVNEDSVIDPVSAMDRQIITIENMLLEHPGFKSTILRLGGLIGEDRHPVQYIVKRPVVEDANNPVNMIHRKDIIRFMEQIVKQDLPNEIFNVVAPISSNRRDFYTHEAQQLGLTPLPLFTDNPGADMRRVNGEKIVQRYGLAYEWLGHTTEN